MQISEKQLTYFFCVKPVSNVFDFSETSFSTTGQFELLQKESSVTFQVLQAAAELAAMEQKQHFHENSKFCRFPMAVRNFVSR